MKIRYLFSFLVLQVLLLACATNPVTGRKQASMVSNDALFEQSFAAYNETLKTEKVSSNQAYNDQVRRVGKRIQTSVETFFREAGMPNYLEDYQWEYKVIESDQLNAWCMPGGKVAFYTAILPVCKDDTGVAVVMGHEIAHAVANHGAERMSQNQIKGAIGAVGAIALGVGGVSSSSTELILQAYGVGTDIGLLTYSRKHESEADEMGLLFMALAGYDPAQAPKFWERMEAESSKTGSGKPPEFLSTHPSSGTRINDLNKLMPVAQEVFKTKSPEPYLRTKNFKK